ncbi:MAG: 4Fe-4S binding protein [Bacteroidales bacterium]|nr:4Fe-4S binding protein [Bacteroidales bacterium]MCF8389843.1 4Fe-4S binding protein [Bacteroidales bacterium]
MQSSWKKYSLSVYVFLFVIFLLSFVQLKVENPMIILERFVKNGGWFEILAVAFYGSFIVYKMQDPGKTAKWRMISWTVFTVVFFSQLLLGLFGFEKFLMTGKLHLPIPMMILSGPVYRGELSIMTLLFLSTVILTGPAWCSQLCYFGALDNISASKKKPAKGKIKNRTAIKFTLLFLIIFLTIVLRWFKVDLLVSTLIAAFFGIVGVFIIIFISARQGKMIHCLSWCPIGTIVNYTRFINPFRMYIDSTSCTLCNLCTSSCNYDALNREDIKSGKPGISCTLCGDCVSSCHASSIKYKFFKMKPESARGLYLFLTISLHAVFLALGRI